MRKRGLSRITAISAFLVLSMAVAGCAEKPATETGAAQVTEAAGSEQESTEAVSEAKPEIDFSAGISDEDAKSAMVGDSFEAFTVTSHSVEATDGDAQYIAKDTVSVEYATADPSGILPQTVSKDVVFGLNKDSEKWEVVEQTLTKCAVDTEAIPGSIWKSTLTAADAKSLFGDEISEGEGELYFKFNKRVGLLAFNLGNASNTDTERFYTTTLNGKMNWVTGEGSTEISFKVLEGSVTDAGDINMVMTTDAGKFTMNIPANAMPASQKDYDTATGEEVPEGTVYKEELATFTVTSESHDGDMWKNELGSRKGNMSPELTWDAVDGAQEYVIMMIDNTANNWLHWFVTTEDKTHFDEGEFTSLETGYVGPYPEDLHKYSVYVVALKSKVDTGYFLLDKTGEDINAKLTKLNTAADGTTGNVISYGEVKYGYAP